MKKTRFTESQIVKIFIKQQENGIPTKEICVEHGISEPLFTIGTGPPARSKYEGIEVSDVKRLKDLKA